MAGTTGGTDLQACLEIDLGAVAANWRILADRHAGGAVAAVVKADAYGLGAASVAPALWRAGCRHYFVAHAAEAEALLAVLPAGAWIAVLNPLSDDQAAWAAAAWVRPVLNTLAEIAQWAGQARRLGRALPALLHVDTGMNRLGLDGAELARLHEQPDLLAGIELSFIMTHLVSAELADDPLNTAQLARFAAACAGLPAALRSVANSSGIFLGARFASDLARPGAALYGINPTPGAANPMRDVVRLSAPVLQIRALRAGESVGYNASWRATAPARIATIGVGYADGYPRALSNRASATFDGRRVPLVGRVSMDLSTFDVTALPGLNRGDRLELIGPSTPPDRLALDAGTSGYEILTSLGPRYQRRYRG